MSSPEDPNNEGSDWDRFLEDTYQQDSNEKEADTTTTEE